MRLISQTYLAKNYWLKILRQGFVDERAMITATNIFLLLENPSTFLLTKEKTWKCVFKTNSKLSQNRTVNQIMPFKTTINWLFTDIWCYLVIGYLIEKLSRFFRQRVLRVSYPLIRTRMAGMPNSGQFYQWQIFSLSMSNLQRRSSLFQFSKQIKFRIKNLRSLAAHK